MSSRIARVIVLVEDKQQRTFVSRLLQELGYSIHKLKLLPIPAGEGSGEQYVREQYPLQVKEMRPRARYQDVALVVAIDADAGTVADRQKHLSDELESSNIPARTLAEKIIHLVPRRNIESWIAYLLDTAVAIDETMNYPKLKGHERDCQGAVEQLARLFKSTLPLPVNCPPSLVVAISELKRFN